MSEPRKVKLDTLFAALHAGPFQPKGNGWEHPTTIRNCEILVDAGFPGQEDITHLYVPVPNSVVIEKLLNRVRYVNRIFFPALSGVHTGGHEAIATSGRRSLAGDHCWTAAQRAERAGVPPAQRLFKIIKEQLGIGPSPARPAVNAAGPQPR